MTKQELKQNLMDYVDACELVVETERDIQRLPYELRHYSVSGIVKERFDKGRVEKEILE